jgi:putative transposase
VLTLSNLKNIIKPIKLFYYAGTFSQIYIQIVFAVKGRNNLILPSFEEEVHKYISGIVTGKGQKSLAVNGMPDHIHALVGLKPVMCVSDLVRDIKNNSTNFINKKHWLKNKFSWQEGLWGIFLFRIKLWKGDRLHCKSKTSSP